MQLIPGTRRNAAVAGSKIAAFGGIIHILSHAWPSEDCYLGIYDLWHLQHLSESERAKTAFNGGFFMIGSAGNGDLLVIPRRPDPIEECEIGLISHEGIWEDEIVWNSIYEPVCRGFLALLKNAGLEGGLPLDFHAARKKNKT